MPGRGRSVMATSTAAGGERPLRHGPAGIEEYVVRLRLGELGRKRGGEAGAQGHRGKGMDKDGGRLMRFA